MALLLYHTFSFFSLFSYGLYHLIFSTLSLLTPTPSPPKPYHPLPTHHHLLRHLPLYLALLSLLISALFSLLLSTPHHLFISLQSASSLLLFSLLALSLLLPSLLPSDLTFLIASLAFSLLAAASSHSAASYLPADLQSKCASLSSLISASSAAFALSLAVTPRLFISSLALGASISLQGLWSLQTGLSLYVESFIPEGCHRLLAVPQSPTRCDLEDSRLRAAAILDLAFVLHTTFIAIVVVVVYIVVARVSGGVLWRHGSYEALSTSSSAGTLVSLDHVQMKAITKNSMQA